MNVDINDYFINKDNTSIKVTNIQDVFLQNFDITWANLDRETSENLIAEKDLQHKIAPRTWDRIPEENFNCEHKECDESIIYKYNNEYYRCDDFINMHDGLHILFAGCSETEGVGGSIENTWTNKLYKEISKSNKVDGFYSIARAGYGWQKIITNFQIYANKYGFPEFFFVLLPNIGRQYKYDYNNEPSMGTFRYYQLYQQNYYINDGLCITDDNKKISIKDAHKSNLILLEEYYKLLLDFKISWELFENFCNVNGTKMLWSTYDPFDVKNFNELNIGKNFFSINTNNVASYVANKTNFEINKNSFVYRDGHFGSAIKEYWAEMFLNEIKNRNMLKI